MDGTVSSYVDDDERWRAVLRRDRQADGVFYYSVRTTGIYSRPSCVSRPARRANTVFFTDPEAAERAGYRPCRRCRPRENSAHASYVTAIAKTCELIHDASETPNLDTLAEAAGFSRFHFHRVFKRLTGVTPQAYVATCRADRLRRVISEAETVTEAIYRSGFTSQGNFYAVSQQILGMTPTNFRMGADSIAISFAVSGSPLGPVLVAKTEKGICSVLTGDQATGGARMGDGLTGDAEAALVGRLRERFPKAHLIRAGREFDDRVAAAVRQSEPPRLGRDLPLNIRVTAMSERLRKALRDTPSEPSVQTR
ncbi:bifunctional transcriptional activator/DNA repair enzyme AdaA [Streptomyces sp. Rer75]|uniref:bifunctional transcriptional activator/DNA repair enzyme AdaA n=1 Tax=unclassified Streptomyces TaxID=2593676 RepID=UPI0015D046A8|nr:Ada metal-binding domain-containing protein [Streptomyces sp. Rer75]QLH25562.1 helix-turn-helix domain-containing protein [Streptomyces sp. Rer75]